MTYRLGQWVFLVVVFLFMGPQPVMAQAASAQIGIVVMHGKGGRPDLHVAELASALSRKGYLVANLEMPWSKNRQYDVSVESAVKEVNDALNGLRGRGATSLFVSGMSLGGLFALHYGNKNVVNGIIAIAPGGNVANNSFREKLGETVGKARTLLAAGQGHEKLELLDFESSKGTYPIVTTPANYVDWFSPDGALNQANAVRNMNPAVPVLYVGPTRDYPPLIKIKQTMFDALPRNSLTALYEPDATHIGSASASIDEIVRWTMKVTEESAMQSK